MLPAPLPQTTSTPVGSQAFRRSFPATHGDSGSNSNGAPSFASYLSSPSPKQQFGQVDEDYPVRSSAEEESVGAAGQATAEAAANPRQRAGQEALPSGHGQHARVETNQQESGAAGPSSTGGTADQEQREGGPRAEAITPGEPNGDGGKAPGSGAASGTTLTSNISGRLGRIPAEALEIFRGLQHNSGSAPSGHVQGRAGSTPISATPISTEVEPLEVAGQRPIGGTGLDLVPSATSNAAGEQGVGLRRSGLKEASDSEIFEDNPAKAERPNQAPLHPGDVSRDGITGAISSELLSATLRTRHGAPVGQKPSVKPVAVAETAAPARQEVFRQPSETPASDGQEVFRQPSDRMIEEPSRAVAQPRARFSEALISENAERAVPQSRIRPEPARESRVSQSGDPSARAQQPPLPDRAARTRVFPGSGSDSVVPRQDPEVSTLTGLPPNDSASLGAAFGTASPPTPEFVPTPRKSTAQASEQRGVRGLIPPSADARRASVPRLPLSVAELSIEPQPDGSSRDRVAGHSSKLEVSGESSKPASGHSLPKDGKGAPEPAPVELSLADRETSGGRPGTGSRRGASSGTDMSNTAAGENAAELRGLSKPARSPDGTPPSVVKTAAPAARGEVAAASHAPAESKASFALPSRSSAQSVDAGSVSTEAYQEASSAASRVRSVERLVDMAALHRKVDSHQMNLVLSDDRIGRMSVRLVERGGVIDTLVRTDSARASHLFTEGLPSLIESLAQRGLQASTSGAGHFLGSWEDAQSRQGGRHRPPRHPQRQSRRGEPEAGRVFRLELE